MACHRPVRVAGCVVLIIMILVCGAPGALAQSNVGQGPLTGTLTDTEPLTGVLSFARIKFAPGLTIREIGWDSNVFDESPEKSPKEDYVAAANPDVSAFARLRFVRVSAYAGSELTYYKTYASERSTGYAARARVDLLLSNLRPFVGAGRTRTRTRPNGEIDTRADRVEEELSGGLAYDLSSTSLLYGAAYQTRHTFEDALESGVNLGDSLTREGLNYQAGLKTDITPLLSVQLFGSYQEDRFKSDPARDSESRSGTAMFRIAPDAIVNGAVTIVFRDMTFADPGLRPFRGLLGTAFITYPFLEFGRFNLALTRGVEYSFDGAEAYYLENSATLSYTHRIVGAIDVQARGGRSFFDYSARETIPAHKDTLDTVGGSLGYNLRNRTRIAVNYEYSERRSPEFTDRNYERRRAYLSWMFAF